MCLGCLLLSSPCTKLEDVNAQQALLVLMIFQVSKLCFAERGQDIENERQSCNAAAQLLRFSSPAPRRVPLSAFVSRRQNIAFRGKPYQ